MAGRFTVEAVFKAIDQLSAPVRRMSKTITKFTRGMERGLRKVNKALIAVTKSLGKGLVRGATAAAVAGVALALTIKKVANEADSLAKQARRLDFPIEELQEWRFVAEQSGLTVAEFDKSLEGMSKRFGEARAGTGSLFTFLQKTDKALLRQVQSTKSVSAGFNVMVKAIQESEDPLQRAALANAAFGRQGLKLANLAELGADKIAKLRAEQRENGVITKEQAEAAEIFNDALNSLKRAGIGFLNDVILPLLPLMTEVIMEFRQFALENKDLISAKVLESIKFLIDNFDEMLGRIKLVAKAIGVFVIFTAIMSTLTGVLTLFNLVAALNPLGLIVLGAIALIALFTTLVVWIDDIVAAFDEMPAAIQFMLAPFDLIIKAIKFIKDNIGSIIKGAKTIGNFVGKFTGFADKETEQIDKVTKIIETKETDRMTKATKIPLTESLRPSKEVRMLQAKEVNRVDNILDISSLLKQRKESEDDKKQSRGDESIQAITTKQRLITQINEERSVQKIELLVKDETGRVEISEKQAPGTNITIEKTGSF